MCPILPPKKLLKNLHRSTRMARWQLERELLVYYSVQHVRKVHCSKIFTVYTHVGRVLTVPEIRMQQERSKMYTKAIWYQVPTLVPGTYYRYNDLQVATISHRWKSGQAPGSSIFEYRVPVYWPRRFSSVLISSDFSLLIRDPNIVTSLNTTLSFTVRLPLVVLFDKSHYEIIKRCSATSTRGIMTIEDCRWCESRTERDARKCFAIVTNLIIAPFIFSFHSRWWGHLYWALKGVAPASKRNQWDL